MKYRRGLVVVLSAGLLLTGTGTDASQMLSGPWTETRFHTGCDPGPFDPPPPPEHLETRYPPVATTSQPVSLRVDLAPPLAADSRPILGSGFNLENALWSCPAFRGLFRTEILDPFKPAIARVDTGLLPAAPADLSASQLGPAVYESVLSSAPYADSWRFFQRLNRAGVKIILGVWGGPDAHPYWPGRGSILGASRHAHGARTPGGTSRSSQPECWNWPADDPSALDYNPVPGRCWPAARRFRVRPPRSVRLRRAC